MIYGSGSHKSANCGTNIDPKGPYWAQIGYWVTYRLIIQALTQNRWGKMMDEGKESIETMNYMSCNVFSCRMN